MLHDRATNRSSILLTGFGPFPNVATNATSLLVPRLAEAARRSFVGMRTEFYILPTEWSAALHLADELYRHLRPSVALHFGVSRRATGFEIETRARNVCIPSLDAAGLMPPGDQISPGGPEYLTSTLPASHIIERLRRRGIPAMLSRDAGGYLCNAVLYRTQEIAREADKPLRSGFIHLPATLVSERMASRGPSGACRLAWREVVEGGIEIIAACLGQPTPRRCLVGLDRRAAAR